MVNYVGEFNDPLTLESVLHSFTSILGQDPWVDLCRQLFYLSSSLVFMNLFFGFVVSMYLFFLNNFASFL